MLKTSLKAALLASCFIGVIAAAEAQTSLLPLPPVTAYSVTGTYAETYLPPPLRYQAASYVPTEPEAFPNESDEMGYSSGATENPHSP